MKTPKFAVGDRVTMTNDYGAVFKGKTITEVEINSVRGITYYITPTDAPWFAVSERNLSKETASLSDETKGGGGDIRRHAKAPSAKTN